MSRYSLHDVNCGDGPQVILGWFAANPYMSPRRSLIYVRTSQCSVSESGNWKSQFVKSVLVLAAALAKDA